jgi:hypothetical protein
MDVPLIGVPLGRDSHRCASHGDASRDMPRIGVHLRDVPLIGVPLIGVPFIGVPLMGMPLMACLA